MIHKPVVPAISYRYVVVTLCVVSIIPYAMFRWGMGVLFPFIQEDLDTSRAELGLIVSGMAFGAAATALLVGWLVDVLNVRRLQTASLIGAAAGVLLFSQIRSPMQGLFIGLLMGTTLSVVGPAYIKAIMDWVTPRARGLSIGIAEASIPVSGIIAAVLISFLAVSFGWRKVVILFAVLIAVSGFIFYAFYRDKTGSGYAEGERATRPRGRISQVAKNPDIWLTGLYGTAHAGVQVTVMSYLVLFLREHVNMSTVVAGVMLAVFMAGGAAGRIGWGLVSDLLLRRRRVATLALVGIFCAVSMALMAWLPSDAPLVVVSALTFFVGANAMGWSGVRVVLIAELAGLALTGTATGFTSMISFGGSFGIAPLFGWIVDRTDSYDMAWWMLAGLSGVGTLMLAFLRPQSRRL